jgi:hypothetical protein
LNTWRKVLKNSVKAKLQRISGLIFLVSSLFISGCMSLIDYFSGRSEACEILAIGKPAKARVLDIYQTGTLINKNPVVGFVLQVTPEDGKAYEARTEALISYLDIPQIQPGRELPIKVDPQQPKRVAIDLWDCN